MLSLCNFLTNLSIFFRHVNLSDCSALNETKNAHFGTVNSLYLIQVCEVN